MKRICLYVALTAALVIISVMGTYIVMDTRNSSQPEPTVVPTIAPSITPTMTPTNAPVKKQTNTAIQSRIAAIDKELEALREKKRKLQELLKKAAEPIDFSDRPAGYNPMNDIENQVEYMKEINADIRIVENQINTLNAERSQLLINQ